MSSFALPYAQSETLGFVPQRLERITAIMARQVEEKKAPGVSMLIARHGKIAYRESVGDYFWGGWAGTTFRVSPQDSLFAIFMTQAPDYREHFGWTFGNLLNAAIL